jgi:protein-S-isoprenylcysteine O-methyltransferase Ste14
MRKPSTISAHLQRGEGIATIKVCLLVLRTSLEDRVLQDELPGFRAYARRVRYRLIPGVW